MIFTYNKKEYFIFFNVVFLSFLWTASIRAEGESPVALEAAAPVNPAETIAVVTPENPPETPVSIREKKDKEGYVLNLKQLLEQSKKKIGKVNDKIKEQAVRSRNQQREEKAREYYDQAMRLYDEGKFEKATELFEKAIKITEHPEMKGYVSESVRKTQKQNKVLEEEEARRVKRLEIERGYSEEEVEKKYNTAIKLFKQKKYLEAKTEFELVEEMFPDHQATRSYIMLAQREIDKDQERLIGDKMHEQVVSKKLEKEQWKKDLEIKERDRQQKLESQSEDLYREGVNLYKIHQYEAAKDKFNQIEWVLPEYKDTDRYLVKIRQIFDDEERYERKYGKKPPRKALYEEENFEMQKKELAEKSKTVKKQVYDQRATEEAGFVYEAAVNLYKEKKFDEARARFREVEKIYPGYKKSDQYLEKLSRYLDSKENARLKDDLRNFTQSLKSERSVRNEKSGTSGDEGSLHTTSVKNRDGITDIADQMQEERKSQFSQMADQWYEQGIEAYNSGNYELAKAKFIQVEATYPHYKETLDYLARMADNVPAGAGQMKKSGVVKKDSAKPEKKQKRKVSVKKEKAEEAFKVVDSSDPAAVKSKESARLNSKTASAASESKEFVSDWKAQRRKRLAEIRIKKEQLAVSKGEKQRLLKNEIKNDIIELKKFERMRGSAKAQYKRPSSDIPSEEIIKEIPPVKIKALPAVISEVQEETLSVSSEKSSVHVGKIQEQAAVIAQPKPQAEIKTVESLSEASLVEKEEKTGVQKEFYKKHAVQSYQDSRKREEKDKKDRDSRLKKERVERERNKVKEEQRLDQHANKIYQEGVLLYKGKQYSRARMKFSTVQGLAPGYKKSRDYMEQIDKILGGRDEGEGVPSAAYKTKKQKEKEFREEVTELYSKKTAVKKRKEEKVKVARLSDEKRQKELEQLENDIDLEEKQLALERRKEEDRLVRLKMKKQATGLNRLSDKETKELIADRQVSRSTTKGRQGQMADKRQALDEIVADRQVDLRKERARIQKQFDQNLENLYQKAMDLYRKGHPQESYKLFAEIDQLKPGYKKTKGYLQSFKSAPPSRRSIEAPSVPAPDRRQLIDKTLDAMESQL